MRRHTKPGSAKNFKDTVISYHGIKKKNSTACRHGKCYISRMEALRAAIPIFNGRVSPLLDVAGSFIYADIESGKVGDRHMIKLPKNSSITRLHLLKEKGVSLLVCSAVSRECACAAARIGITILPGIIGEVDEVLDALANDVLNSERFAMPGCCGRFRAGRGGCSIRRAKTRQDDT